MKVGDFITCKESDGFVVKNKKYKILEYTTYSLAIHMHDKNIKLLYNFDIKSPLYTWQTFYKPYELRNIKMKTIL